MPVAADVGSAPGLAADQLANARTILAVAKQRGVRAYG
jgi:hypothetical protein